MSQILTSIQPYNNYGSYLRKKHNGHKVYKIIVDGGFTCPNRDGSKGFGGCTYCNVDSFTPEHGRRQPTIGEQIEKNIQRAKKDRKADKFIIYFQPNTNTYAPVHYLKMLYDEALSRYTEDIVGLSVGTRPDCIDAEKIALLESYTDRFDVDLEIGMESIYNETLSQINRGCSHDEFLEAISLVKNSRLELCVHTIFGLPGETHDMMLKYVDEINRHPHIKYVKFHHLHIVEGSIMGVQYKRNPFPLFTLEAYTDFLCEIIPRLRPDVIIQRLFGLADQDLLIAPNWGLKKSDIQHYIDRTLIDRGVVQGSAYFTPDFSPSA
ncbi:MAG: TIGR01212 family radical SAM protein [Mucilaginibacter polytrichastri]|nr:TIGR01212 family radical SAM protein [Mucilaginibacter polytrichastri]